MIVAIALVLILAGVAARTGLLDSADADRVQVQGLEDAVAFDPVTWFELLKASEQRLVDCMSDQGFEIRSETVWAIYDQHPHGLFGVSTPSAELAYLLQRGYGMTEMVDSLLDHAQEVSEVSNDTYLKSLPRRRQHEFRVALAGPGLDGNGGCMAQTSQGVADRLDLPEGGELGEEFSHVVGQVAQSSGYERWASRVVHCMEERGVVVPHGELPRMWGKFLRELLALAGSTYEVDGNGHVHYDLSSDEARNVSRRALERLRAREMKAAHVEAACRVKAGSDFQDLVDRRSARLVREYPQEVEMLRSAMMKGKE